MHIAVRAQRVPLRRRANPVAAEAGVTVARTARVIVAVRTTPKAEVEDVPVPRQELRIAPGAACTRPPAGGILNPVPVSTRALRGAGAPPVPAVPPRVAQVVRVGLSTHRRGAGGEEGTPSAAGLRPLDERAVETGGGKGPRKVPLLHRVVRAGGAHLASLSGARQGGLLQEVAHAPAGRAVGWAHQTRTAAGGRGVVGGGPCGAPGAGVGPGADEDAPPAVLAATGTPVVGEGAAGAGVPRVSYLRHFLDVREWQE